MVGYISRVCNAYLKIDFYQCTVRCVEHLHKVLLETFFKKGSESWLKESNPSPEIRIVLSFSQRKKVAYDYDKIT